MHEGHRQRMFEKLESGGKLEDHELLEVLLFFCLPRINTNEIAHSLLDSFGDLASVFEANCQKLETVDGIGEKTARFLYLVGRILSRIPLSKKNILPFAYSFETFAEFLRDRYHEARQEYAEIFSVRKTGEVIHCRKFTSDELFQVDIPASEIASFVASFKPRWVIFAHNHLYGGCQPSKEDDFFTKKLYLYLDLCGVELLDHYIISPQGTYSFMREGRMEEIRNSCSARSVLETMS